MDIWIITLYLKWESQCVHGNTNFRYRNVSKTHWHCQCVMEKMMYLNSIFHRTHWNCQCVLETFEIWDLEMSPKTHWVILLINVWSVWSVLWRNSPFQQPKNRGFGDKSPQLATLRQACPQYRFYILGQFCYKTLLNSMFINDFSWSLFSLCT